MAVSIGVCTRDEFLWQKIYLALRDRAIITRTARGDMGEEYDVLLYDEGKSTLPNARRIGRDPDADIALPLSLADLDSLVDAGTEASVLRIGTRAVYLREKKIALTEVEFALFKALYDAHGEFVSREALLNGVWDGECDSGILNVYVHYLREKLEDGEKIILSSRKFGYRIDERYFSDAKRS
jgi:DNA-binding response OmpR family regulator